MSKRIRYELENDAAHIVLDDGKVNVMSVELLGEIDRALDRAVEEARLVVLRSARPGIFSAGFDLEVFATGDPERTVAMVRAGAQLALRLLSLPLPTVGVLCGHAFPMGAFLLLACDLRIGARGPYRMGLNEVAIGIVPPRFAIELARSRLHPAWLHRTVALGEMYEPDEAREAGFLDRVVDASGLGTAVATAVESILATVHPISHGAAKRRLHAEAITRIRGAIDEELTVEAYSAGRQ
jgi:enoyl-CoA hydratase